MNKRDYMNNLLSLCTDRQKDLFSRIYPDGVSIKQLKWATTQLENTLKGLDDKNEQFKALEKEAAEKLAAAADELEKAREEIEWATSELAEADRKISRLSNPVSIENSETQERLALLSALEAAGVDNWDGFDFALEQMRSKT